MTHISYDPLFDPHCQVQPQPDYPRWRGSWIWYPSQLTTHLHAKAIQATAARCSFVGYPGNYRQPIYQAHFRYHTTITQPQTIQWQVPAGRARIFVNGQAADFTRRTISLQPGAVSLVWIIDFCASLPCIIVDGIDIQSAAHWQTSLDGINWTSAESLPHINQPALLPDDCRDVTVQIPSILVSETPRDNTGAYHLSADTPLILDFGHIELGRLQFSSSGSATLQVTVGESLPEALSDDLAVAEQRPLVPITSTTTSTTHTIPERALRFVRIQSDAPCRIDAITFLARVAPIQYHGTFTCSDPQLDAIWQAGAATIHACLHDFFVDGLRRDGLPWADQLSEVQGADCVFFDTTAARHSLLALTLPDDPTAADLGIIDHPLLLPLSFNHDWMTRGDAAFITQYLDRLRALLDLYHSLQDEQGLISAQRVHAEAPQRDKGWNFFPDWAHNQHSGPDTLGTPTYSHMQLMLCFAVAAKLEATLGDAQRAIHYHHCASQLRHTISTLFWDANNGAFFNGLDRHGVLDRRYTAHAQVWGILTDLLPANAYDQVFTNVIQNPDCRVANISLNHHWEFAAYVKAGRIDAALAELRHVWGGWLGQGHRRFPEDFRPLADATAQLSFYGRPFANSLCHGWAGAAAVTLLSHGLLGITPLAPGFKYCQIAPQLGGLAWVRGSMPTPHGTITVAWDGIQGEIELPAIGVKLVGCTTSAGHNRIQGPGTFVIIAS